MSSTRNFLLHQRILLWWSMWLVKNPRSVMVEVLVKVVPIFTNTKIWIWLKFFNFHKQLMYWNWVQTISNCDSLNCYCVISELPSFLGYSNWHCNRIGLWSGFSGLTLYYIPSFTFFIVIILSSILPNNLQLFNDIFCVFVIFIWSVL